MDITHPDMNYYPSWIVYVFRAVGLELYDVDNIKMRKVNIGVIVDTVIAKRSIKYIRLRYIIFSCS